MGKPMSATPTPESMVWQGGANTLENRCHTTPPLKGGRGWWGVHHLFGVGWGELSLPGVVPGRDAIKCGIRTHETPKGLPESKTGAFDHSANSPYRIAAVGIRLPDVSSGVNHRGHPKTVPMPPFPSGHETGWHTCAFALCQKEQDYRASSLAGSVSEVSDCSTDRSASKSSCIDSVAECISPEVAKSFTLSHSDQLSFHRSERGSNLNLKAASFDSGGGFEGFCKTSMAQFLKGSSSPFSTSFPNMPTAICDIVAAVCRWVLSLFQRKRANAATTAIMGFARISSLSQMSFVSLMPVSNFAVLGRLS